MLTWGRFYGQTGWVEAYHIDRSHAPLGRFDPNFRRGTRLRSRADLFTAVMSCLSRNVPVHLMCRRSSVRC